MAKMGRPSNYNDEMGERICDLVATYPVGLPKLCDKFSDLPDAQTIRMWRWKNPDFDSKYARAKRMQAEIMAESMEDVIDDLEPAIYQDDEGVTRLDSGMLMKARLTVDTRKWTASKLAPKIYGDAKRVEELETENARYKAELEAVRANLAKTNIKDY